MKRYRSLIFSFLLIGTAVSEPNSYASNPFLNGEYTNDINAFLADQARQNDVDLTSNVFLKRMINDQSGSASALVDRFSGPEYLPPVSRCPGNQVCVYKGSCKSGYFQESNLVTSKKECDANSEVCCTYRPPPTQPRATPCNGNDYACVPPNKCVNGFVKVAGSQKTSSIKPSPQCYGPGEICCRIPVPESTELTPNGYVVRVPDIPFETPTQRPYQPEPQPSQPKPYPQPTPPRPYQPQPTQPKPYQPQPTPPKPYQPQPTQPRPYQPQPTQPRPYQPQPTQPRPYQPQPTQPKPYQPQPTQPKPYQPQPTQPKPYQPQPTQPRPYQPTQKPYQPTQKPYQPTQKPYQPTPAPYEPTRKPPQTPGYLPPDRVPQPSDIYPSPEKYPTEKPYQPTQKPYQPTQKPYQPTQKPYQPTQKPYQPTQKPYQPTQKPYQPTQRPQTPGYLPPDRVPEPSQTNPTRVPKPTTTRRPPTTGDDILSQPIKPSRCAAALNCTDITYCTANGFISKTPVILTKDQELYRVPLTDCRDDSKGIRAGKCCRDPDYTDPWPVTQLGRYDSSWFGDDGSYKPAGNGNGNGARPPTQVAQPSVLKGNAVLNDPIGTGKGICTTRNFNGSPKGPGPDDAAFGEYPWQAMVLLESTKSLLCGGAIVGDDLVLTTAHCVQGRKPFDVLIKGGEWKLGRDEEPLTFQISRVKKIDVHPHYEPNTNANDLAVLHLDSKLKLEPHIAPICIDDIDPTPQDECVTTGWGKEALRLHAQDAVMKHSPVNMMTAEQCQKSSDGYRYQQGSALCGSTVADACLLDPGSGLACANKRGHYVLKGLYSVEDQCGQNSVVTFSKIDSKWVNQVTGGKKNPVTAASSSYTSNVKAPLYLPPTV